MEGADELTLEFRSDPPESIDAGDLQRVLEQTLRVASGCLPMVLPASQSAPFSYDTLADTSSLIPAKGSSTALPPAFRRTPPLPAQERLIQVVRRMALAPVGLYGASAAFALHGAEEPQARRPAQKTS